MNKNVDYSFLPAAKAAAKRRERAEEIAREEKERDELQRMLLIIFAIQIAFVLGTMWQG